MPYNGSGSFSTVYNWQNDAANGLNISSSRMQGQDQDFANGLSNCMTRDGQSPAQNNIPMGGFRLTGLGAAVATTDAVNQAYGDTRYAQISGSGTQLFNVANPVGAQNAVNLTFADARYLTPNRAVFFIANGSWTVPSGVTGIFITAVGGGGSGGGGGGNSSTAAAGGGGGGGQGNQIVKALQAVVPGSVVTIVVGAGGSFVNGGTNAGTAGSTGNAGGSSGVSGVGFSIVYLGGTGGGGGAGNTSGSGIVIGGNGGQIGGGSNTGGGQPGGFPTTSGGTLPGVGGAGGGTVFGPGGLARLPTSGGTGSTGVGFGSGGGGGTGGVGVSAGGASGQGTGGAVLIEW